MYYISSIIKPITSYYKSQIYTYNVKDLAKKNLLNLYKKFFLYAVMRLLLRSKTEDDIFLVRDICN